MQVAPLQSIRKKSPVPNYLYAIGTIFLLVGIIAQNDAAGAGCCLIIIGLLVAASTKTQKPITMVIRNNNPHYVVQPQVVYQQQHSTPTVSNDPLVQAKNWVKNTTSNIAKSIDNNKSKSITPNELFQRARELELARDWKGAAEMYQEAGMYEVAGRIRKEHLEKGGTVVNIAKVGDTHVHDSVVLNDGESTSPTCPNCQYIIQAQWNTCPQCQSNLS